MVNPSLQETIAAMSEDERVELVEFIETTLVSEYSISEEQKDLIRSRANDTDPSHWLSKEQFQERLRAIRS